MLVLTGLADGKREGWNSACILSMLGGGLSLSVGFVAWQMRAAHPLLNLTLLRQRIFSSACVESFIYGAGLFGSTYLVPLFAQGIQRPLPEGLDFPDIWPSQRSCLTRADGEQRLVPVRHLFLVDERHRCQPPVLGAGLVDRDQPRQPESGAARATAQPGRGRHQFRAPARRRWRRRRTAI